MCGKFQHYATTSIGTGEMNPWVQFCSNSRCNPGYLLHSAGRDVKWITFYHVRVEAEAEMNKTVTMAAVK